MNVTVVDADLPVLPVSTLMRRQFAPDYFFGHSSDDDTKLLAQKHGDTRKAYEADSESSRSVEVDQESATSTSTRTEDPDSDTEKFIHFQTSPRIAYTRRPSSSSSSSSHQGELPRAPESPRSLPSVSTESVKSSKSATTPPAPEETLEQRADRLAEFAKFVKRNEFFDREDYELAQAAAKRAAQERDDFVARLNERDRLARILQERERVIEEAVLKGTLVPAKDQELFAKLVQKQVLLMRMLK
jgi:hypothetical protein